jgi:hypothetical protein
MSTDAAAKIQSLLAEIQQLAREVEEIPDFGPSVWQMREGDKKCAAIRAKCQQISQLVGTGSAAASHTPYL